MAATEASATSQAISPSSIAGNPSPLVITATLHGISGLPEAVRKLPSNLVLEIKVRAITATCAADPPDGPSVAFAVTCPDLHARVRGADDLHDKNGVLHAALDHHADWSASITTPLPPAPLPLTFNPSVTVDYAVDVSEVHLTTGAARVVDSRQRKVSFAMVHRRKIVTEIVGTSAGQVGISFSVSAQDANGYRRRLVIFATESSPDSLKMVDSILSRTSEIMTFTRIFKKFGTINYPKRVTEFFELYGPEHLDVLKQVLDEWKDREEDLMRTLVLDNGPEPRSIEPKLRAQAFFQAHPNAGQSKELPAIMEAARGKDSQILFAELKTKFGPEPDPRGYLFPKVTYEPPAPTPSATTPSAAPTPAQREDVRLPPIVASIPPTPPQPLQPQLAPPVAQQTVVHKDRVPSPIPESQKSFAPNGSTTSAPKPADQDLGRPARPPTNKIVPGPSNNTATASPTEGHDCWKRLEQDLTQCQIPSPELYYLTEENFASLIAEMGHAPHSGFHQEVLAEWRRRVTAALRQQHVAPGEKEHDALKLELPPCLGVEPLALNVLAVVQLRHGEHESAFSSRLAAARQRQVERVALAGDYSRLMAIATHGLTPSTVGGWTSVSGIDSPNVENSGTRIRLPRKPFSQLDRPTNCAILVCDVIIGKSVVLSDRSQKSRIASNVTQEFDSITVLETPSLAGESRATSETLIFTPQQLLPRYLVHCTVDLSQIPCPLHPGRAAEYFVVDESAFCCGHCAVMGVHHGKRCITLEEAALQARSQLMELSKIAANLQSAAEEEERQATSSLNDALMSGDVIRQRANVEIESIQREAELRIQSVRDKADQDYRRTVDARTLDKEKSASVAMDATELHHTLTGIAKSHNAPKLISAVVDARQRSLNRIAERLSTIRSVVSDPSRNNSPHISNHPLQSFQATTPFPIQTVSSAAVTESSLEPESNDLYARFRQLKGHRFLAGAGQATTASSTRAPTLASTGLSQRIVNDHLVSTPRAAAAPSSRLYTADSSRPAEMAAAAVPQPRSGSAVHELTHEATDAALSSNERKSIKDKMSQGWAAFRLGDKAQARKCWQDIADNYPQHSSGARANAYMCEALDKDYPSAAMWYERSLRSNPDDCMTLFNYAVMLESVVGKKREALALFEAAHRLGDQTAGRRAALLRQQLVSQ